jgi:hypothetical protein
VQGLCANFRPREWQACPPILVDHECVERAVALGLCVSFHDDLAESVSPHEVAASLKQEPRRTTNADVAIDQHDGTPPALRWKPVKDGTPKHRQTTPPGDPNRRF